MPPPVSCARTLPNALSCGSFPRLRFQWDVTRNVPDRIERLIVQIHKEEENNAPKLKE